MEQNYLDNANSFKMFLICLIPVVLVIVQAFLFLIFAIKQSKDIISKEVQKKVIVNAAIFSIVPSLPIVISIATLIPILGQYIPWFRLSVVGSVMYESAVADMTFKFMGLAGGNGDPNINMVHFVTVVWVMTCGMLSGSILNVFLLKSYDKKLKSASNMTGFAPMAIASLFPAIILFLGIPKVFDFKFPLSILAFLSSGICVLVCGYIAKITKIKLIEEFSFPISMLTGMLFAVIFSPIFT